MFVKASTLVAALALGSIAIIQAEQTTQGSQSANPNAIEQSGTTKTSTPTAAAGSASATKVLADLHRTNTMEIEMGNLAQQNGQSEAVKEYGEQLVNDHQETQAKVSEVAEQLGIALPEKTMSGREHAKMEKLKALSGAQFDKEFAKSMAQDHGKEIKKLEAAQKNLTGPTASLIEEVLPVLRKHQATAQQLARAPAGASQQQTKTQ